MNAEIGDNIKNGILGYLIQQGWVKINSDPFDIISTNDSIQIIKKILVESIPAPFWLKPVDSRYAFEQIKNDKHDDYNAFVYVGSNCLCLDDACDENISHGDIAYYKNGKWQKTKMIACTIIEIDTGDLQLTIKF